MTVPSPTSERGELDGQRVLIIHSGGDSRRLPHCSAIGKLFARIPRTLPDGRASTLFDEFLVSLSGLAAQSPPGVLVASGDVLLIFDHLQLDFQRAGVIGVAAAAPAEVGTHHGVYVTDHVDRHLQTFYLRAYLHKPSLERLSQWKAIAGDGTVGIDTGLVWLDKSTVSQLVALAQRDAVAVFCGLPSGAGGQSSSAGLPPAGLNLYGDLLAPLVESTTFDDYLADTSDGPDTPALQAARRAIWERLRGISFTVERLQPAVFAHFGTSREYWEMVAASPEWSSTWGWTRHAGSWVEEAAQRSDYGVASIGAVIQGSVTTADEPGLLVDTHVSGPLTLEGAALIAGLRTEQPLRLEADVVLHQLPVEGDRYVTRVFGLYDDPKRSWDDPAATYLNRPWTVWLDRAGIDPETIWDGVPLEDRTLWNARLYPLAADREESVELSLPLQDPVAAPPEWQAQWEASDRLSLAESFRRADGEQILAEWTAIEDEVAARHFYSAVVTERPAAEAKHLLGATKQAAERRGQLAAKWLAKDDPILRLRGYKALAVATDSARWEDRAFETLAEMIERTLSSALTPPLWISTVRPSPARRRGERSVRVEASARIDFGGGWTDTPPYSIERGGTVLNAAITLYGAYPIVAEAAPLPEPKLVLESRDINVIVEPTYLGEMVNYANPADPFALLKAALVLRGIVPASDASDASGDPGEPLAEVLQGRGGVRLCTQTSIPRGSGLGTSSIMAGAVLACLARLLDVEVTQAQLFDEVLCLEQMLTTGGGWQDQVGGLTGGIKLVTSVPGLPQRIEVAPVQLSAKTQAELNERLLLVYTGQQRLAKNLLQAVMGRWMARDPEMVWIQGEIARLAVSMRDVLESGNVDGFGALLGEHWSLNKRMDPGCTNPFIDDLFEGMSPYICGGKLAGAGGGGFAIVVARDAQAACDLSTALERAYPGTSVGIWPCAIPSRAMAVS